MYKRQLQSGLHVDFGVFGPIHDEAEARLWVFAHQLAHDAVSYTHLRAHETVLDLVCRLLLEKKTLMSSDAYCSYRTLPKQLRRQSLVL